MSDNDDTRCENQSEDEEYPNLLVAIGASAGGVRAIGDIVEELPEDFQAAVVVATHRAASRDNLLAQVLQNRTRLKVFEPTHGEELTCTRLYVGRGQEMIEVEGRDFQIDIDHDGARKLRRIDDLFVSVAESAGENAVGVVLTGMLWDGVAGLQAIDEAGGVCIVQDPLDASFASMPLNALDAVDVDYVGTTKEIAHRLVELARNRNCR